MHACYSEASSDSCPLQSASKDAFVKDPKFLLTSAIVAGTLAVAILFVLYRRHRAPSGELALHPNRVSTVEVDDIAPVHADNALTIESLYAVASFGSGELPSAPGLTPTTPLASSEGTNHYVNFAASNATNDLDSLGIYCSVAEA